MLVWMFKSSSGEKSYTAHPYNGDDAQDSWEQMIDERWFPFSQLKVRVPVHACIIVQ